VKSVKKKVTVIAARCKECGYCIEFCPKHVLAKGTQTNRQGYHAVVVTDPDKCSGCNLCSMVCPDFAIYLDSGEED
jgi:2-oxoglutarate ferredoxin oxidoreductase subunit delta